MGKTDRVKIRFDLNREEKQDYETETLWAEPLTVNSFRILNSPFFVFGISLDDVVQAQSEGDCYRFERVIRRGGHSTYRIFLQGNRTISDADFRVLWDDIAAQNSTFENANGHFVAVDVPPNANIQKIYHLLEEGEKSGIWAFDYARTQA